MGLVFENIRIKNSNDELKTCQLTEPVEIHWKDHSTVVQAIVLDGASEVLLGASPLKGMNLIVDPVNRKLAGANRDEIIFKIK